MYGRSDLIATPEYNKMLSEYGQGTLHMKNGDPVNSPQQAKQMASQQTGQSFNKSNKDQVRTMSKTVIPSDKQQERRMNNPGKNEKFVGSREGGPSENKMTQKASINHENPEFFKRQSDRKKNDQFPFQTKQIFKGTKY